MKNNNVDEPTVVVRAEPNFRQNVWHLSFDCPWCPRRRGKPQRHTHGGGELTGPPDLGHRASDCEVREAPSGYELALDPAQDLDVLLQRRPAR